MAHSRLVKVVFKAARECGSSVGFFFFFWYSVGKAEEASHPPLQ